MKFDADRSGTIPGLVSAWNGAGHQVIAAEAYHQLSPATKAKVNQILKAHPDYQKWKESFTGDSSLDLDMFIFSPTGDLDCVHSLTVPAGTIPFQHAGKKRLEHF